MKQQNRKTPLVFRVSLVLLCALVVSLRLTGGLYARYSTTATGGDSARVAKFAFSDNYSTQIQNVTFTAYPGFQFPAIQITNQGEVAIKCTVKIVNLTGNLPIAASQTHQTQIIYPNHSGSINPFILWNS